MSDLILYERFSVSAVSRSNTTLLHSSFRRSGLPVTDERSSAVRLVDTKDGNLAMVQSCC